MRTSCMTGLPAGRVLRVLVTAVAVLAFLLTGAGAALAHDEVVATTPAAQASVATPPAAVELQLSSPPQALGTEVRVTAPDGSLVSVGAPEVRGTTVRQPLSDGLPAGGYTVEWRVTSGDGHPITGSSAFNVTAAASPSTPATPSAAQAAPDTAPDDAGAGTTVGEASATQPAPSSSSTGLLVAVAVLVLALAGLVLWRLRRRA